MTDINAASGDREYIDEALRRMDALRNGAASTVRAVMPVGRELRRSRDPRHSCNVYVLRNETGLSLGEEVIVMASVVAPELAAHALYLLARLPLSAQAKDRLALLASHDIERHGIFPDAVVVGQFDVSTWLIEVITPERPLHAIRSGIDQFVI